MRLLEQHLDFKSSLYHSESSISFILLSSCCHLVMSMTQERRRTGQMTEAGGRETVREPSEVAGAGEDQEVGGA